MATIQASMSTYISATPEEVFSVLTDPPKMAEWMNGVQSAEWEAGSEARTGGRFDMKYKYGRKTSDIKMEIVAVSPGSLYEFKTVEGPYPVAAHYTIRPTDDGTTITYNQIAYSDSILSAVGFLLTGWFAKSMVRRVLRKDLEKLGAIVEGLE